MDGLRIMIPWLAELIDDFAPVPLFCRLMTAHLPARAVAGGTERARLTLRGSGKNVGSRAHRAADQDRLAGLLERAGKIGMAWSECARGAFAMHEQALGASAIDPVFFHFAGVVRDVIKKAQFGLGQDLCESLPRQMRDDLAVSQRAVDGRTHGSQIGLADRRLDGSAGQFPVRELDVLGFRGQDHLFQETPCRSGDPARVSRNEC